MFDLVFVSPAPEEPAFDTDRKKQHEELARSEPRPVLVVEEIDVGGTIFKTTPSTLCKSPFLAALVDQSEKFITRDSNDRIFVDRDPILFGHILKFLRSGQWPSFDKADTKLVLELRTECGYFGLEGPSSNSGEESLDVVTMVRLDKEDDRRNSRDRTDELVPRVTLIGKDIILQEVVSLEQSHKYMTGIPALCGCRDAGDMAVAHFEDADEALWTSLESALLHTGWLTKSEAFNVTLRTEIRTDGCGYGGVYREFDVQGQGRRFVFTRPRDSRRGLASAYSSEDCYVSCAA